MHISLAPHAFCENESGHAEQLLRPVVFGLSVLFESIVVFRAFNILMVVLFLLSASVQPNDPDPLVWISLYVLAAVFSIAHAFQKLPAFWSFAFALFAFLWALRLLPEFWGQAPLREVFGRVDMKTEAVEVAREFGGLMIITTWMVVLGRREIKRD